MKHEIGPLPKYDLFLDFIQRMQNQGRKSIRGKYWEWKYDIFGNEILVNEIKYD